MNGSDFTEYQIDLVICLDVTASMKFIDVAKRNAREFSERLERRMNLAKKSAKDLRVRVIAFRDLGEEGDEAIASSPWYLLPAHAEQFHEYLNGLEAKGGGNLPESSLEALWLAMNSSWRTSGNRRRSIILLMTDDTAHPLGKFPFEIEQSMFPTPRDLEEFQLRWGIDAVPEESVMGSNINGRRLLLLAPEMEPWTTIGVSWPKTLWAPTVAGSGLTDREWDDICDRITESV